MGKLPYPWRNKLFQRCMQLLGAVSELLSDGSEGVATQSDAGLGHRNAGADGVGASCLWSRGCQSAAHDPPSGGPAVQPFTATG
jgi:hypothetical protein